MTRHATLAALLSLSMICACNIADNYAETIDSPTPDAGPQKDLGMPDMPMIDVPDMLDDMPAVDMTVDMVDTPCVDRAEVCDGEDNNCNELVDEGCACVYKNLNAGICMGALIGDLSGICESPPSYLTDEDTSNCDGLDNDCDGVTDEGCACLFGGFEFGVCQGGVIGLDGECVAPENYTMTEDADDCDGLDNDCDGESDESCNTLYKDIAVSRDHTCKLTAQGEIICQGRASYDRLVVPQGPFDSLVVGASHTCALRPDGTPVCWGRNTEGESTPPANVKFSTLSATDNATCGLELGTQKIFCWGDTTTHNWVALAPSGEGYTALDTTAARGCALKGGEPICWGDALSSAAPFNLGWRMTDLRVAEDFACGTLTGNNGMRCWGSLPDDISISYQVYSPTQWELNAQGIMLLNEQGELVSFGDQLSFYGLSTTPINAQNAELKGSLKLSLDEHAACLITQDNKDYCWGRNTLGALKPITSPLSSFNLGKDTLCTTTLNNELSCRASVHPVVNAANNPMEVALPAELTQVLSVAPRYVCGKFEDDTCACWGRETATLDLDPDSSVQIFNSFEPLFDSALCEDIKGARSHLCMLDQQGSMLCKGDNSYDKAEPPSIEDIIDLSLSPFGYCARTRENDLSCQGRFTEAMLSDGTLEDHAARSFVMGERHACVLSEDGTPKCAGSSDHGIVDGAPGLINVKQLVMGLSHACVLRNDDLVECWGLDSRGQASPPQLKFKTIQAADHHSCGITMDDSLVCW